jgi:hypothetical protein
VALKEEITAVAPVRRLEKGNVNTTLIRKGLTDRNRWQYRYPDESCDQFQCPKDTVLRGAIFGIVRHGSQPSTL